MDDFPLEGDVIDWLMMRGVMNGMKRKNHESWIAGRFYSKLGIFLNAASNISSLKRKSLPA